MASRDAVSVEYRGSESSRNCPSRARNVPNRRHDFVCDIDRGAAFLDRVHILGEGDERPFRTETGFQRIERHAFDLFQGLQDQAAMLGLGRRDAEAAISDHRRGHAMPGRDGHHPVPHDLRVIMGVYVDKAGADNAPGGVDGLPGRLPRLAQRDDPAVPDANIAAIAGFAAAVDDGAAGDLDVVHGFLQSARNKARGLSARTA